MSKITLAETLFNSKSNSKLITQYNPSIPYNLQSFIQKSESYIKHVAMNNRTNHFAEMF